MDTYPLLCRLCGSEFVPEHDGQLYCTEDCESADKKIDEAEARREEKDSEFREAIKNLPDRKRGG